MTDVNGPRVGGRLPAIELPGPGGRAGVSLQQPGGHATLLVLVHGFECQECLNYLQELAAQQDEIRGWDGRVVVVAPAAPPAEYEPPAELRGFALAIDAGGRLQAAGYAAPGVVVADEWGELFAVQHGASDHDFMSTEEAVEWLRFLAIQCPECQGEAL